MRFSAAGQGESQVNFSLIQIGFLNFVELECVSGLGPMICRKSARINIHKTLFLAYGVVALVELIV